MWLKYSILQLSKNYANNSINTLIIFCTFGELAHNLNYNLNFINDKENKLIFIIFYFIFSFKFLINPFICIYYEILVPI